MGERAAMTTASTVEDGGREEPMKSEVLPAGVDRVARPALHLAGVRDTTFGCALTF